MFVVNDVHVTGLKCKHENTQREAAKTLFQSPKATPEDSATGLGMDLTDEGDMDKQNFKRSDPSKL